MSVFVVGVFVFDPEVPQIGEFVSHLVGVSILKGFNSDPLFGSPQVQILIIPLQLVPDIIQILNYPYFFL